MALESELATELISDSVYTRTHAMNVNVIRYCLVSYTILQEEKKAMEIMHENWIKPFIEKSCWKSNENGWKKMETWIVEEIAPLSSSCQEMDLLKTVITEILVSGKRKDPKMMHIKPLHVFHQVRQEGHRKHVFRGSKVLLNNILLCIMLMIVALFDCLIPHYLLMLL